jgi:hypothetical protein
MKPLHDEGDFALCDEPNCNLPAWQEFTQYDDDGDDIGTDIFCIHHHPNGMPPSRIQASPIDFEQVAKLIRQTDSLNAIQHNLRNHRGL